MEEFYIIGLRNPFTVFYDSVKEEVWVADVGQERRGVMTKGSNGQWPYKEGSIDGPKPKPASIFGHETPPIYDYGRSTGQTVIGGFIYRGSKYTSLKGKYIFGDYGTQDVWALDPENGHVEHLTNTSGNGDKGFVSIIPGVDDEIYLVRIFSPDLMGGTILELSPPDGTTIEAPQLLSEVGAFVSLEEMKPIKGFIPYDLNAELYANGAYKKRWMAIPNDGVYDLPDEQINIDHANFWKFPPGTVFIKHFELPIDEKRPDLIKKIETRFLIITEDQNTYGLTYKWNDEGTDAELLNNSDEKDFEINRLDGSMVLQKWSYPSRSQCLTCHNANAGFVLGPKFHSLKKDYHYPGSQLPGSQMLNWNHLNLFSRGLSSEEINMLPGAASLQDLTAANELKVRSYIDMNCSFCHRPNGVAADFDARFSTHLKDQNIIDAMTVGRNSLTENSVIAKGDTIRSEMWRRVSGQSENRMPPLGPNTIDREFVKVLKDWIMELGEEVTPVAIENDPGVKIYPNPVTGDKIYIDIKKYRDIANKIKLRLLTMNGELLFQREVSHKSPIELDIPLQQGIYLLNVQGANAQSGTYKLIRL